MNNQPPSLFSRHSHMLGLILLTVVSACSVANQLNPVPGLGSLVPTKVPTEIVGPDSEFTIQTPPLLTPGAKVKSGRDESGMWYAAFTDDLCREFGVAVRSADSTVNVEEWVRTEILPGLEKQGAMQVVERTDTVQNIGAASFVKYRFPKGAPCRVEQIGAPLALRRKSTQPDADVAHYTFRHGARVFIVTYGRGILDDSTHSLNQDVSFGIRVGPAEDVVRKFVAGFAFRR